MWVERWRDRCRSAVAFVPCAESPLPREDCERAVQWIGADGARAQGAEAVFSMLAAAGEPLGLRIYRAFPPFAALAEAAYAAVAKNRPLFSTLTRLLWGSDVRAPRFSVGCWLFLRGLALVYLTAFVSLAIQVTGLIGERGILPAGEYFQAVRAAFGEGTGWMRAPSLFYFARPTDFVLLAGCIGGALVAFAAALGIFQAPLFFGLWALYLSYCVAGQIFLAYQWDALLLEAGLLAAFLAPWRMHARVPLSPPAAARFLVVWLLFRLLFSSGVVKLTSGDSAWWPRLSALEFHFVTQPLPNPAAWWADKLPGWAGQAAVLAMFFVELVLPWFLWAPRRLRHLAVLGILLLQAGIALTGNYGFFNLLTGILCLPALDDRFWSRWWLPPPEPRRRKVPGWLASAAAAGMVVLSLAPFASAFRIAPRGLEPVAWVWEQVAPLRSINAYGLFAIMTTERLEILVEGSEDGMAWKRYEFRYKPGCLSRPPPVAGLHMPRLDWQMWFAALGRVEHNPWFLRLCARLLEAEPSVLRLLAEDPFQGARPAALRANLDLYRFTTPAERAATGDWWAADPRAIYLHEVVLERRPAR